MKQTYPCQRLLLTFSATSTFEPESKKMTSKAGFEQEETVRMQEPVLNTQSITFVISFFALQSLC